MNARMNQRKNPFVSEYLLYLLAASSEIASAQFHAHVRSQGVRIPEWRVLACLVDAESMMSTKLADFALMEQSRMSRIIDQMASQDLVERIADTRDKRRVKVRLTSAGKVLANRLVDDARTHEAKILSDLADTGAARIKSVLQSLLERLQNDE